MDGRMGMNTEVHMRTITLASTRDSKLSIGSGPGAPIFEQNGEHTRIYRAPCRAIASVRFDDKEIYGQVLDISPGGCLLLTETTLEVGQEFEMRVTIVHPSRRAVAEVSGIVQRTGEQNGRKAYGVKFSSEQRSDQKSLDWLYGQAISP